MHNGLAMAKEMQDYRKKTALFRRISPPDDYYKPLRCKKSALCRQNTPIWMATSLRAAKIMNFCARNQKSGALRPKFAIYGLFFSFSGLQNPISAILGRYGQSNKCHVLAENVMLFFLLGPMNALILSGKRQKSIAIFTRVPLPHEQLENL